MSDKLYEVPAAVAANAYIDADKYQQMYAQSISNPEDKELIPEYIHFGAV